VLLRLEAVELVELQQGALDDRAGEVGSGRRPRERTRPELRCPAGGHRGGTARLLAVELVALPEPDRHHALAVHVGDRELLEAALGLAGVHELLERGIVGRIALEQADNAGVCVGVTRRTPARAYPDW